MRRIDWRWSIQRAIPRLTLAIELTLWRESPGWVSHSHLTCLYRQVIARGKANWNFKMYSAIATLGRSSKVSMMPLKEIYGLKDGHRKQEHTYSLIDYATSTFDKHWSRLRNPQYAWDCKWYGPEKLIKGTGKRPQIPNSWNFEHFTTKLEQSRLDFSSYDLYPGRLVGIAS